MTSSLKESIGAKTYEIQDILQNVVSVHLAVHILTPGDVYALYNSIFIKLIENGPKSKS